MVAPATVTGAVQARLFVKTATSAFSTPTDLAAAKGASGFNTSQETNLLKNCTAAPEFGRTGNTETYNPIGQTTSSTIPAQADLSEVPFEFAIIEADTLHDALLDSGPATFIELGLEKKVGTAEVIYYAKGSVSSVSANNETPATATVTVALAEDFIRLK